MIEWTSMIRKILELYNLHEIKSYLFL